MEAPDLTSSQAFAALLDEVATGDAKALLVALYGTRFADSFRDRTRYHGTSLMPKASFVAGRHPKPHSLARFLTPLLRGRVAYDGSQPNRKTRVPGWWMLNSAGEWRPTTLSAITSSLLDVADALLEAADARHAREYEMYRATRVSAPAAEVGMLPAALDSIRGLVAGGTSRFSETAAILRDDEDFELTEPDQDALLREWLVDTAVAAGWAPGSRVPTTSVWEAYVESCGVYPKHAFMLRLDRALGPEGKRGANLRTFGVPRSAVPDAA